MFPTVMVSITINKHALVARASGLQFLSKHDTLLSDANMPHDMMPVRQSNGTYAYLTTSAIVSHRPAKRIRCARAWFGHTCTAHCKTAGCFHVRCHDAVHINLFVPIVMVASTNQTMLSTLCCSRSAIYAMHGLLFLSWPSVFPDRHMHGGHALGRRGR